MKILHAYVGSCVESEFMNDFGKVVGIGIEPTFHSTKNVDMWVQADLRKTFPIKTKFDFGLFHPPCKKFSTAKNTSHTEYENHIPRAKDLAKNYCDYWVIENIRNSPIGFSPDLRLNGGIFDLPLKYERVFWTNFDIEQPELKKDGGYEHNLNTLTKDKAEKIKGYDGYYYAHDIVKNSLPKPYLEYIFEYLPIV
jgi:hypothetical protein